MTMKGDPTTLIFDRASQWDGFGRQQEALVVVNGRDLQSSRIERG